jgi:adenylate cyclase
MGKERWEIERRFLVRTRPGLLAHLGASERYRQGYVRTGDPSVRIRVGEDRGPVLTLKRGKGIKRREVEATVPLEVAEELLAAAGRRVLSKTRWRLGRWELDRFEGELDGLELMEVELDRVDEEPPGVPEGVEVLCEVTDDRRFTSSALARIKRKDQARFVRKVYEEFGAA